MMPSVSPRIRAAPPATSLICSTLEARVPSLRDWCIQVTRLYRLRIRHNEVSAVSSTEEAGTLQTAMPAWMGGKREGNINPCKNLYVFVYDCTTNACSMFKLYLLTELSCCFHINVVKARADPDNYSKAFKLFQVVSRQSDSVVQQGSHCLI